MITHACSVDSPRADVRSLFRIAALSVLLPLAACGGGGGGSSGGTGGGGGGGGGGNPYGLEVPPEPTLSSIQEKVFTPICTDCHAGASAPQGLRLEAGMSYGMLVNVASVEVPSLDRVEPGDPDNSYIIHKLEGTQSVGERMPLGGPYLPSGTIAAIRQWITDGAMNNKPAASGKPVSITSGWPVADSQVETAPRHIVLIADGELDTSLLHAGSVELFRLDPASGYEKPIDISVRVTSLSPTVIEIDPSVLPAGSYKLRVAGSGNSPVADRSGHLIDGDGDGVAGGDFVVGFKVGATE